MSGRGLVLVTGGSGYIAGFCILRLISDGWHVRATVRSLSRAEEVRRTLGLKEGELSIVAADLTRDDGWDEAVEGCTYVLHVASPIPATLPKSDDELVIPARDGALRVLKAAKAAGIKRVVMTASTACIAYGMDGDHNERVFDETRWTDPKHADTSPYVRSKTLAEQAAWDFAAQNPGFELVTINPGAVLGPVMGADFSPSIEIVKKLLGRELPGCPRLGFPLVDVRDVAEAHVRAMTHPSAAGERFQVAGPFLWFQEIARVLKARAPDIAKRVPTIALPNWMIRLSALFDPITRSVLYELDKRRDCSSAKAERVLGVKLRPVEESIVETARSLVQKGLVKA